MIIWKLYKVIEECDVILNGCYVINDWSGE